MIRNGTKSRTRCGSFPGNDESAQRLAVSVGFGQSDGRASTGAGELVDLYGPATAATTIAQRMRTFCLHKFPLTFVSSVFAVLIIVSRWVPYDPSPASPVFSGSLQRATDTRPRKVLVPQKAALSNSTFNAQTAVGGSVRVKAPNSAFRRLQVGPNEVDYIASDVTIRQFRPNSAQQPSRGGYKEVDRGTDVTIRYFPTKPAAVSQNAACVNRGAASIPPDACHESGPASATKALSPDWRMSRTAMDSTLTSTPR